MKYYKDLLFPIIASVVLICFIHIYMFYSTPVQLNKAVVINIKKGTSAFGISRMLDKRGVISSSSLFMITAFSSQRATGLKAGRYAFYGELSPKDVIDILFYGKTIKCKVTIPEGSDIFDIADILSKLGLVDRDEFIKIANSRETARLFDFDAPTMEGYLFPETYFMVPTMSSFDMINKMVKQLDQVYTPECEARAKKLSKEKKLKLTRHEVLTMASLIEKEAITPEEMPVIASVFYNRLKRGMKLQSDPSAIYGIDRSGQKVFRKDLSRDSAYNTYKYKGLPIGPICNPGKRAIIAALYPAKTNYLYFVSQGDRTHYFSKSLKEHNRAIARIYK
jgi:UPF0755 protein